MYEYIKGRPIANQENYLVLENGGIGYKIYTTLPTLERVKNKEEVTIYTYLYVREDALDLFGFSSPEDIGCFKMLLSVSGVGPKMALSIMTELSGERFALAVVTEDTKMLTQANGVGPKLAKRIILELKDKIKNDDLAAGIQESGNGAALAGDDRTEAINALMVLGYSRNEALSAMNGMNVGEMSLEEIIKTALKKMMK